MVFPTSSELRRWQHLTCHQLGGRSRLLAKLLGQLYLPRPTSFSSDGLTYDLPLENVRGKIASGQCSEELAWCFGFLSGAGNLGESIWVVESSLGNVATLLRLRGVLGGRIATVRSERGNHLLAFQWTLKGAHLQEAASLLGLQSQQAACGASARMVANERLGNVWWGSARRFSSSKWYFAAGFYDAKGILQFTTERTPRVILETPELSILEEITTLLENDLGLHMRPRRLPNRPRYRLRLPLPAIPKVLQKLLDHCLLRHRPAAETIVQGLSKDKRTWRQALGQMRTSVTLQGRYTRRSPAEDDVVKARRKLQNSISFAEQSENEEKLNDNRVVRVLGLVAPSSGFSPLLLCCRFAPLRSMPLSYGRLQEVCH